MVEDIVWTVTVKKSWQTMKFSFPNVADAIEFAESAARNYQRDDDSFSVVIRAVIAEFDEVVKKPEEPAE
jgi:hypothetical protein